MARDPDNHNDAESSEFINARLPNPSGPSGSVRPPSRSTPVLGADEIEPAPRSNPFGDNDSIQNDQSVVGKVLQQSAHPTVAIFHILFKLSAIASYLLIGLFTKNFVVQFVVTVTLLAFDFWVVKNVTGRLLVGLRWWHEVAEDGITQQWRFETIHDRESLNVVDGRIFWWTLYAFPIVWFGLGVICVLKFNVSYLIIVLIALLLSAANIVGYYKCSKDATEQIRNYIGKTVIGHAMEQSGFGRLSQYV